MSTIDTTGWTEEQKAELRALLDEEVAHTRRLEEALAQSVADTLASKRKEVAAAKRDADDAAALKAALNKFGEDRVSTYRTRRGLLILVAPDRFKSKDQELMSRYKALRDAGREDEADLVWTQEIVGMCVHPERSVIEQMLNVYPRLSDQLTTMYGALATGFEARFVGK